MRVIAGSARRLNLVTPPGKDTRPTTDKYKETLFNILQPYLAGCDFLDLFAGSGAIGIEALSRGARSAVFVEKDRRAQACIKQNLEHTHLADRGQLLPTDVIAAIGRLEREGKTFDVIFMDPPYGKDWARQVLNCLAGGGLLTDQTIIVVEEDLYADLDFVSEIGLEEFRRKEYKTNQHVFIRRRSE